MAEPQIIQWHNDAFHIDFIVNMDGVICLSCILPPGSPSQRSASPHFESSELPLISVKLAGEGNTNMMKTARSLIGSYISSRLNYKHHKIERIGQSEVFSVVCCDDATSVEVTGRFTVYKNIPVLRSEATVKNISDDSDIVVTSLSSLTIGGMTTASAAWFNDYTLMYANNSWFREAQWQERTLPDLGIDNNGILELNQGIASSLATFGLSARGCCSTSTYLPMGILKNKSNTDTWLWQVEANGSWRWEIGDWKDSIYLAAGGPTGTDHSWKQLLRPGQAFTSVPVACCRVSGDIEDAFSALTDYRREIRRPHDDMERVPIIFNDYMNCLMGDPDEHKIEELLDPVVKLGAEYFVIDAGWYADDSNWWDDVGLWESSTKRFPSGFDTLLSKIQERGLVPGLWLEPEVVGIRSEIASRLPKEAFFSEDNHRVVEKGRYQLDYRHPDVIARMNQVIDNLVINYGAGYFKFDHNVEIVQGTDVDGPSTMGSAHLEHQRAYLTWVASLLDRYPGLVIETCAGGAQRLDYATLAVHSIQSTSDQQDPALYAAIAAALPTAVTPEQSGTWAYPQAEWSDELNALTMINSLLGRVYLSGRVDKISSDQRSLVREGIDVYVQIRDNIKTAHPTWPLGLPKWHDDWVALGLISKNASSVYLAIWRRGGPTKMKMHIKGTKSCQRSSVTLLYPTAFETGITWDGASGLLSVELPDCTCARLFKIE